jgi:RNA polymerase sigma factor (sigma-70 family)
MDDWQLLREYVGNGSESAFSTLVSRYINLVHSVALRRVNDQHLAQEVSQTVFILLARKAGSFRHSVVLPAWLFRTARFVAARAVRSEHRRQRREQESVLMQKLIQSDEAWPRVAPVLEEVLEELGETDRSALLLRFYQDQSLREVGSRLGVSEEAAKKRVARALEKLRGLLIRRGVTLPVAALAGLLASNAVQSAPAGLAAVVGAQALAQGVAGSLPALAREVLDAWRMAKLRMALGGAAALLVAGFVAKTVFFNAPSLHAKQPVRSANQEPTSASTNARPANPFAARAARKAAASRQLLFRVVDAETGWGIAGAEIHARYWLGLKIEPRDDLVTDDEGLCPVPLPVEKLVRLDLGVLAQGHAQKFLSWWPSEDGPIPASYEFKLPRAVDMGGVVRSPDGQPVAGATIEVRFPGVGESNVRERQRERLGFNDSLPAARTDAQGRWQCAVVPPRYVDFSLSVRHPDFPQASFAPDTEGHSPTNSYYLPMAGLLAHQAVLQVKPGFTLCGLVVNEQNQPISDARICVGYWADPGKADAATGADGTFSVRNLSSQSNAVTVVAEGYSPERVATETGSQTAPTRVVLKPGLLLRLRVVDPGGQPVPHADVALSHWETRRLERRQPADAEGRYVWNSAPKGALRFSAWKEGYAWARDLVFEANGEEHLITLTPMFRVTGRVVDGETGEPIAAFKTIPGYGSSNPRWDRSDHKKGVDGEYDLPFIESGGPFSVRIEAEGYETEQSDEMRAEAGPQTRDFKLRRKDPRLAAKGIVRLPDGRPAVGAQVALCTPDYGAILARGRFGKGRDSLIKETDERGGFEFESHDDAHTLLAVHREGFVRSRFNLDGQPVTLRLQPWGRIEGTVRLPDGQNARRHMVLMDHSFSYYRGGMSLDSHYQTTSDREGSFVIEQVPSGDFDLSINPGTGIPHTHRTPILVKPGQTLTVEIGTLGLRVMGRLVAPEAKEPIDWSRQVGYATLQTKGLPPQPPAGLSRIALERWKANFWDSEAGRAQRRAECSSALTVAPDGSFTAEGLLPGTYDIFVTLYDRAVDRGRIDGTSGARVIGYARRREIVLPDVATPEQPLDLGAIVIDLTPTETRR